MREGLHAHAVAARLSLTPRQFYARRPALVRDHGFPEPLPCTACYDPAALQAWQDRHLPAGAEPDGPSAESLLILRARAMGTAA